MANWFCCLYILNCC